MKGFLLDTNALLWLELDRPAMRSAALEELVQADLYVSVMSAAEIAIKASIGKLSLPPPFETDFGGAFRSLLERSDVGLLTLDLADIEHLRTLPFHHRDPFDRIIISQAFARGLRVATRDRAFLAYHGLDVLEV